MSEIKLLPCPFCGGEAEFHRTPVKSNGGWCDSVVVRCKVCEARTNRVLYDAKKHPNGEEYDEAMKAWNTRKSVENVIGRLEDEYDNIAVQYERNYESGLEDGYAHAIEIIKNECGINATQNSSETEHSETKCCRTEHIQQRFERVM